MEGAPTDAWHPALRGAFATRLGVLVVGLVAFSLGIVMTLRSNLGLGPWDVLHQGIALHSPLSFGVAAIVVGALVIAVSLGLGVRPGLGTLLNALLVGTFVEVVVALDVVPEPGAGDLA